MPVVDASVLIAYLTDGEFAMEARAAIFAGRGDIWAPHLVDAEVGHALRRLARVGELTAANAGAALDDLGGLPILRVGHVGLARRAWDLRSNLSVYDALYVALAEQLGVELLTLDVRLAGSPGIRATAVTLPA